MKWPLLSFVLLSAIAFPLAAQAQSRRTEADRLYNEGHTLYMEGEFEEALARYRAAYNLDAAADIWANIIFCLKDLGQEVAVIAEYDAHVVEHWPHLPQLSRSQLGEYMLHVGKVAGFGLLFIEASVPGVIYLDGKRLGELTPGIPRRVPAGKHVVRFEAPGMAPAEQTVEVHGGERNKTTLEPRRPIYFDARLGLIGGGTINSRTELLNGTSCSVYCFPSTSVSLGGRLSVRVKGPLVAEIGGDYLYARSTFKLPWDPQIVEHLFSLHAAMARGGLGVDFAHSTLRFQSRIGVGFLWGQHAEGATGQDQTARAAIGLPVVYGRMGLSMQRGSLWFGLGIEGITTPFAGPNDMPIPFFEDIAVFPQSAPRYDTRGFGRFVILSPEVSVGGSF